ncbi:MAG: diacylglycerol kinase (ATP) [Myxococcota bacterium]|jgi:diacylglycerol kinase (ATP)
MAEIADRYLAICNPSAGGGRCGKRAPEAIGRLRDGGLSVDVVETRGAGDATIIARDAWASGRRHFIAVGGDGTGYEIVNGLFPEAIGAEQKPTLGFLPLGTGNSFLRDFSEKGAEYSIQAILDGRMRDCDVIRLDCQEGPLHYINILSFGFTADVGDLTNRRFKPLGEAGYILAVVTEVLRLKPRVYPMAVDGGATERDPVTFVSVNNSKYTGGKMMMAPEADPSSGTAALVRVGEMGRLTLLQTFPKIFKGTHVLHPAISQSHINDIDFQVHDPIALMIDGEVVQGTPQHLEVLQGVLRIRV